MSPAWRHRLRRLRFALGGTLAGLLIAVAVLMGLAQLLLPLAARYPQRVAAMLSERLQRPVRFASMDGHWQASGPLLVLHDVRIGDALELPQAAVKLDFGALLWPSRRLVNLRLQDLHLSLRRNLDGTWKVLGFGSTAGATGQGGFDRSSLPGNLWLDGLHLDIEDARDGRRYALLADTLRVSNGSDALRFAGSLRRQGAGGALAVAGRFGDGYRDGRLYVHGEDVDLGRLLGGLDVSGYGVDGGRGSLAAWMTWKDSRAVAQTVRLQLENLRAHGPAGAVSVARVHALAGFERDGDRMVVRYASDGGAAQVVLDGQGPARRLQVRARALDLANLLPLATLAPGVPAGLGHWLAQAHAHGTLKQVGLDWSQHEGLQALDVHFAGFGFDSVGKRPGLDTLEGRVTGDAEAINLDLPRQATVVRMPHTFRKPLVLPQLAGDVAAWHEAGAWHLGTDGLSFEGEGYGGQARGEVRLADAGGRPFLDLYAAITHGRVEAAKLFWPVDSMSPAAVEWLDRGLVSGTLTSAAGMLRGNLADWPFRAHEGRFEARGVIDDMVLDYSPRWPKAEGVHAVANFIDNGMLVEADAGASLGVKVEKAVASIPDFHDGELLLTVLGGGDAAAMLDFARRSPIAQRQAGDLRNLKLAGQGEFGFSLVLPFRDVSDFTLSGSARLHRVDLGNRDWDLALDDLDGTLHFDGNGLRGDALGTRFRGVDSTLDIAIAGATGDPDELLDARLHGRFDVPTLIRGRDALAPLAQVAEGTSLFTIGFDIARDGAGQVGQRLTLGSDLAGMRLKLPAPLDKPSGSVLPLHLSLALPSAGAPLRVALGDRVRVRARLPDEGVPLAVAVALGSTDPASLPARGVTVAGHAGDLDVSGWAQRALAGSGDADAPTLQGVDIRADRTQLFGTRFGALHLVLTPRPQETLLDVDGDQVKGRLTLPTADLDRRGIVARLDRLYWPGDSDTVAPAGKQAGAAPAPASASSVAAPAAASSSAAPAEVAGIDIAPASLPPLHLWVGDLRMGKAHLGEARFESWPTARGMHIDQLRTHTRDVQIAASGDWLGQSGASRTHLGIDFGAENLGSLLNALGFEGLFEGGRTQAHLDASWPGPPSSVALARMDGTLKVDVSKGRIPEVQPGMGRLFGLMSIAELPRRLSLDFGDVFGKGFGFDSITGNFRFADGSAYTDDLKIKGPAAEITVKGRTGLRARDYDQQVLVVPHVGNSLPVVGALAGGPLGAAAGLAVQGILGHGLNKAASARYRIRGSWDKPKITLIEKKSLPQPPSPPVAPGAGTQTPAKPASAPTPAASVPVPAASASPLASPPGGV